MRDLRKPAATLLVALIAACSQGRRPQKPTNEPAPSGPASPAASSTPAALSNDEGADVPAGPDDADSPEPVEDDGSCPEGMLLVEGDYCENLEVNCIKKFHAPQNNLWVCEQVQSPTRCVGPERPMRYCIDRYEFPNKEGVRPMVMQNFYQAQVHCANRGKRICTEEEWTLACEGPERKPFPYGDGYTRDATKCHGDQTYKFPNKSKVIARDEAELERLWQGRVSGEMQECVSDYGVHDMNGNADELAASVTYSQSPKANFDNVTTGGPWYHGVRNMCRPKIYTHDESFAYYYLSWRCCAEPDGEPTEPLAPKQLKRGWTFERVKQLAENSWKLPFNPIVPGEPGYSSSGPK